MGRASYCLTGALLLIASLALPARGANLADEILDQAIQQYNAGEVQPAIGGINAALRGSLSDARLARAYYYRGLAHRKAGQPGQAITDLTRALEYQGLSDAERSDAIENRQVAYGEAGISSSERVLIGSDSDEKVPAASHASAAAATASTVTGSVAARPAVAHVAPAPGPTPAPTSWQAATAASPAPTSDSPAPPRWVTQQVALAPLPPVPVSAASARATQAKVAARGAPEPIAKASVPVAPFVTQVAAVPSAAPVVAAEVRLLVGEARSRNDAFALAVRLTSQRGPELGPYRPQIAEIKFADTAVYRLRLGPFTDANQAMTLCRSLRDSGYDCVAE